MQMPALLSHARAKEHSLLTDACACRRSAAGQLAALAHVRDSARDVGAGIARGRADLEAVLRAEIQAHA